MYRFIESIKVESKKVHLLDFHQARVNRTLSAHGVSERFSLEEVFEALKHQEEGLFKMRVVYDLSLSYSVQMIPYAFKEIERFQLVKNDEIEYSFKKENRASLEEMKNKAQAEEIIIVKNNQITDTSYSNLIFLKNDVWYTPNSCLLNGVQRQSLLSQNKIQETEITLENVCEFSHFKLINALNDFDETFTYPLKRIVNLPKTD